MICQISADIFSLDVQALVNPVNCVGVMGKGLAKAFKERFPENFKLYQQACSTGQMQIGKLLVTGSQPLIINLPTKQHWRSKSKLEDVAQGIKSLVVCLEKQHITSVAIPKLGCGLGGLDYDEVLPVLKQHLEPLATKCYLL